MLQVEIFEYNQKLSEIYNDYYNQFENDNCNVEKNKDIFNFDENIKYKFQLIKNIKHPTISKYLDLKREESKIVKLKIDNYIFVTEYFSESLDGLIDNKLNENSSFKFEEIKKIIYQILISISAFEKKGICLRYLEPKRISISDDYRIKIQNYMLDFLYDSTKLKFVQ